MSIEDDVQVRPLRLPDDGHDVGAPDRYRSKSRRDPSTLLCAGGLDFSWDDLWSDAVVDFCPAHTPEAV